MTEENSRDTTEEGVMKMAAIILNAGGWVPFAPMIFAPKVLRKACKKAGPILNFLAENSWVLVAGRLRLGKNWACHQMAQ